MRPLICVVVVASLIATSANALSPQRYGAMPVPTPSTNLSPEDATAVRAAEALRQRIRVHAMNGRCDYAYAAARALDDQVLLAYVSEMCGTPPPPPPPPETGTIKLWD